jgi:hypothetical protein
MCFPWTCLCLGTLLLASVAPVAGANTLTVVNVPPGATVEINGLIVGTNHSAELQNAQGLSS